MRTVRRLAKPLNTQKHLSLKQLCQAYVREKKHWIRFFQPFKSQAYLARPKSLRDEMLKQNYQSPYGLQARHWKLALEEAAEVWDKYWQAIFVKVRSKISRKKNLSEPEQHYAYWLLKGYAQFTAMMQGQCPKPSFPIRTSLKRQTAALVRGLVRKSRGKPPSIKKARSVRFDANCYDCFEHNGGQYIKLMSLIPGKRIVVPLTGKAAISGTITLVLDENVYVHVPQELKKKRPLKAPAVAVDFGYTEVMTDTAGIRYGTRFGKELTKTTGHEHQKMQKRHKLHSIAKKTKNTNLRKYNLGKKKQHATKKRTRTTLEKEINTAINKLIQTNKPSMVITEDLHHTFRYDKPKEVNRKLSNWLRGTLQDRMSFKALAEGFEWRAGLARTEANKLNVISKDELELLQRVRQSRTARMRRHEQVNPAYGSQSCPYCEFVDPKNRIRDSFRCLYCGHEDISDRIAALNYARRIDDPEIGRYTPYREVKTILLDRFHRRLETGQPVTVPGRTLETVVKTNPPSYRDLNVTARSEYSRANWTVTQRAKQNEDAHICAHF
jgi:putative transposase